MFSNVFEDRDKRVSLLVKVGDCLGRSLRENVILFSINSYDGKVNYLTESNKVIEASYDLNKNVVLSNINVQDASVFDDDELYDQLVETKINKFIENIHYSELAEANHSFDDVLDLWHNRLKLETVRKRLFEKSEKLADIEAITESDEFGRIIELGPQIVEFLKEKKDKVLSVPEVRNAVQLSNTISEAFNFPRLSYEDLHGNSYTLKDGVQGSIYEMICRQELVKKELVESKKQFSYVWATAPSVKRLASCIFESEEKIEEALIETLKEVPYFALASKKAITETFANCLSRVGQIGVEDKDIQEFTSRIFEAKKESKELMIQMLNERYGVDVQNLQEPVSFKSLSNTQVVIFETLSRLAPKGTALKQVLSETASFMKGKYGVECIDVNDLIYEMFSVAGYVEDFLLKEEVATEEADLQRVSSDLEEAKVKVRPGKASKKEAQKENDEATDEEEEEETVEEAEATEVEPGVEAATEDDYKEPKASKPDSEEETLDGLSELDNILGDIAKELGNSSEDKDKE